MERILFQFLAVQSIVASILDTLKCIFKLSASSCSVSASSFLCQSKMTL